MYHGRVVINGANKWHNGRGTGGFREGRGCENQIFTL